MGAYGGGERGAPWKTLSYIRGFHRLRGGATVSLAGVMAATTPRSTGPLEVLRVLPGRRGHAQWERSSGRGGPGLQPKDPVSSSWALQKLFDPAPHSVFIFFSEVTPPSLPLGLLRWR